MARDGDRVLIITPTRSSHVYVQQQGKTYHTTYPWCMVRVSTRQALFPIVWGMRDRECDHARNISHSGDALRTYR